MALVLTIAKGLLRITFRPFTTPPGMSASRPKAEVAKRGLELPFLATSGSSSAPWMPQIRPSNGCGREAVLLAVERWYDFPEFGGYLGNIGLDRARRG